METTALDLIRVFLCTATMCLFKSGFCEEAYPQSSETCLCSHELLQYVFSSRPYMKYMIPNVFMHCLK